MQRILGATVLLALFLACTPESPPAPSSGAGLRVRVETRLGAERADLLQSIGHYGLVYEVGQEELHRFMSQIFLLRDGADIVMAAEGGIELHGAGVLDLIAKLWEPKGQAAQLADAFPFVRNERAVPLREIYDSMRMQIFLPVPLLGGEEIDGPLPVSPQLPRMSVRHRRTGRLEAVELDAYNALDLLLRYEPDLQATWRNRQGQRISVAILLESVWAHYVAPRSAREEFADHSYLHLPEVLLVYRRRQNVEVRHDPNALKERLLAVELERQEYGGYDASEALSHYVESLGFLLAEPDISWTKAEKEKVRMWLHDVATVRLTEISDVPLQHLAHLHRGLTRIEANADRLQ